MAGRSVCGSVPIDSRILQDYLTLAHVTKTPVNLRYRRKNLLKAHDELAKNYAKRRRRSGKFVIAETPLKYLELPAPFVALHTPKDLQIEGLLQHNCVASYDTLVKSGKSAIFAAEINGERVTIEMCESRIGGKNDFYVKQCYQAFNRACSQQTPAEVEQAVKDNTAAAYREYKSHNRKSSVIYENNNVFEGFDEFFL